MYAQMVAFWNANRDMMEALPTEEWMTYRANADNAEVFSLYDMVAGGTITSYEQLHEIMPTVMQRYSATNDLLSVSESLAILSTSDAGFDSTAC